MANAPSAILKGFEYQAYYFWFQATKLFDRNSKVKVVGYEINDTKSFDDVYLGYAQGQLCVRGSLIERDHYSLKFHVSQNVQVGYEMLTEPAFIGATKYSFLERLYQLYLKDPASAAKSRFQLYTPWVLNPNDPLGTLIANDEGQLRVELLQNAGGSKSKFGKVKECWMNHLKVDEETLYKVLRPLRLQLNGKTMLDLRENVSQRMANVGIRPIDLSIRTDPYTQLVERLCNEGRDIFTKDELLEILKQEGLWDGIKPERNVRHLGLRSFYFRAERMEDVTESMLALEHFFDERFIKDPAKWNNEIKVEMKSFVKNEFGGEKSDADIYLDAHSSLVFALGSLIGTKVGFAVSPIQKTTNSSVPWVLTGKVETPARIAINETVIDHAKAEVAVCIGVTWPVLAEVKKYVSTNLSEVGKIIEISPENGTGAKSILNADHAWDMAERMAIKIKEIRNELDLNKPIHLFITAPNGLVLFLGQQSSSFGKVNLYEYDMKKQKHGSYEPSVQLPWN